MKISAFIRSLLLIATTCGVVAAQAAGVQKLGYVNPERVYRESIAAQQIEVRLQKEFSAQQQQLVSMQEQGMKLEKKLETEKLNATEQKKSEERLLEISKQYRTASRELIDEYNLRRNEEFSALQNEANDIIHTIAKTENFDLIVQEAVFVSGKFDITDRVIQMLNEQYKKSNNKK